MLIKYQRSLKMLGEKTSSMSDTRLDCEERTTNRQKSLKNISKNISFLLNKSKRSLKIKSIKNELRISEEFKKPWKRIAKKLLEQKSTTQLFFRSKYRQKSLLRNWQKKKNTDRANTCRTKSKWLSSNSNSNELTILIFERSTNTFLINRTRSKSESLSERSNLTKVQKRFDELPCMTQLYLRAKSTLTSIQTNLTCTSSKTTQTFFQRQILSLHL